MQAAHPLDAGRRADEADEADLLGAALLQTVDGGDRRIAGGEHGRDHDHQPLGKVGRRLEEILDRRKGLRLAVEPDMGDARGRHEIEHALGEGEARAQDWREHELLAGEARRHHRGERRLDLDLGQRQVARDLVADEHADFLEQLTKRFGRAGLVAQQRELVLHQRMGRRS